MLIVLTVSWVALVHVPPFFLFPLVFFVVARRRGYGRPPWPARG
jgi:hypothetical protein